MRKKYTIKDIARQAGVSAATVSYVINHRDDQRISDETKKKIWQIVNLLDYRPNVSAKSLATRKTYNIALILHREEYLYKRSEQLAVADALSSVLQFHGYHLLLLGEENTAVIDYADAILCYDSDTDYFHDVGDNNLIPLIAIDCLTPQQIFFQICTDYTRLKTEADKRFGSENYSYLCLTPNNADLRRLIQNTFSSVIFVPDNTSGSGVQNAAFSGNILYDQQSLSSLAGPDAFCPAHRLREKMERVFACFELASNRVPDCEHQLFV